MFKQLINFIGILLIVLAVFSFVFSVVHVFRPDSVYKELPLGDVLSIGGLVQGVVSGVFYLVAGIGLLNLKKWARYLVILLSVNYGISIINGILIFGQQYYSTSYYIWCVFVVIFTAFCLNNRKKEYAYYIADSFFKKSKPDKALYYSNLSTAQRFLKYYALSLDPNYKEALELQSKVEKEIANEEKKWNNP